MKKFTYFTFLMAIAMYVSALATPAMADAPTATNSAAGSGQSYNWAGYTATGGNFSGVNGTWIVPSATSSGNISADAEWIGIGGVQTNDLIQVGTQTIFSGSQPQYQAWYEVLPSASQNIAVTIKPGDSISASVAQQPSGQWAVSFSDNTTGQNFQTVLPYSSSESSAEWVVEMPTEVGSGFIPLDNFGSAQFSGATALKNGQSLNLSQLGAAPMTMMTSGQQALATPSGISGDGASFTVSRSSVTVTPTQGFSGFGRGGYRRQGRGSQGFQLSSGFGRGRFRQRMNMFNSFSPRISFFINR